MHCPSPLPLLVALPLLLSLFAPRAVLASGGGESGEGDHDEPAIAVLFPWFSEAVGVIAFYLLTRHLQLFPYTALMFVVGTGMGIGAVRCGLDDQLTESTGMWRWINSEVLLTVFLPGLLFRDAFHVNFHLFQVASWQIFIMAFPMVLAGTALTAIVGFYIFPYNWSWNLSMTFGAILAATDPVAVAALLNEVGAPPRLKMHISGESMFNDGSAMVFYTIFKDLFLYELNIGLGEDVDVGRGFAIFFRMALGGVAMGMAFALGLLVMLYYLDRRLNNEENVLQVAATVTIAYLAFYTAEMCLEMSGVISVVVCGILTRAFGGGMINDPHMMESFWVLLEHLLNTVLFALGGVVWGGIIANYGNREGHWTGQDWGYLFLLYAMVQAYRFFLMFSHYPILSRIGLRTNWRETFFMSYAGLRGAVGISLAIALDDIVWTATENETYREYTTQVFGMVGGIAFLTLVINGTMSGPLLRSLGLAKSTAMRLRVVNCLRRRYKWHILDYLVQHHAEERYRLVDFAVLRYHVPVLKEITLEDVKLAFEREKERVPASQYRQPNLENVLPYFFVAKDAGPPKKGDDSMHSATEGDTEKEKDINSSTSSESEDDVQEPPDDHEMEPTETPESRRAAFCSSTRSKREHLPTVLEYSQRVMELRLVFIELLRHAYDEMLQRGEINSREGDGFLVYALFQSLEYAQDAATNGQPLNDWEASRLVSNAGTNRVKNQTKKVRDRLGCRSHDVVHALTSGGEQIRLDVLRAVAFIDAHKEAKERFEEQFAETSDEFTAAERLIMDESDEQVLEAKKLLESMDKNVVAGIIEHHICTILLNEGARYIESLCAAGLLLEKEASQFIEDVSHELERVSHCSLEEHPGELSADEKKATLKSHRASLHNYLPKDEEAERKFQDKDLVSIIMNAPSKLRLDVGTDRRKSV